MTRIGYIEQSYGEEITVAIANTYGNVVLKNKQLPQNTLIIAAKPNKYGYDEGSYSMIMTDSDGNGARLTYTIGVNNGLLPLSGSTDSIGIVLDNKTIHAVNNVIKVNSSNIIDNTSLTLQSGSIGIDVDKISGKKGTIRIDNDTIKISDDKIYVDTVSLNHATNSQHGVAKSDNDTIDIENGVISVNTYNLTKATAYEFGIAKPDGKSIILSDDKIKVNTNIKSTSSKFGFVKCDGTTLLSTNGVISINKDRIPKSSNNSFGIAKFDKDQFNIVNGEVSVKNYKNTVDSIIQCESKISEIEDFLNSL